MANFYPYIQLLAWYFLVAGVLFYLISRKQDSSARRALWTKYGVYLVMVFTLMLIFGFGYSWSKWMLFFLQLMAIREWWMVTKQKRALRLCSGLILLLVLFLPWISFPTQDELLTYYFFVVIFDGFSQAFGQLIKGPRILPLVSPNKTWSGFLGAVFMVIIARFYWIDFGWSFGLIILNAMMALSGDFLASWLKRRSGVKDFPTVLPGHGGILDRFDAFFFVLFFMTIFKFI
jgi:phosphatidate cytidylyltransferase